MEVDSSTMGVVETAYSFGSGLKKNECAIIAQRHGFMDRDRNGGGLSSMTRTLTYAPRKDWESSTNLLPILVLSSLLFNSTWQSNISRVTSHSPLRLPNIYPLALLSITLLRVPLLLLSAVWSMC